MKILVSACLLGENCKYNGKSNYNEKVIQFLDGHEVIPICPEVLGGMEIPRPTCEIVNDHIFDENGRDVTLEFEKAVSKACDTIKQHQIDLVVLQSRSPTCGVNKVYDGTFTGRLIPGMGLFAQRLIDLGYKVIDLEDILMQ